MTKDILEAVNYVHKMLSTISDISLEELLVVEPIIKIEKYAEGTNFLSPGESSQKAAITLSGLSKTFYLTEDGKEHITHFGAEGSFIGVYTEMLKNVTCTGFIQAIEPCTFMVMDYQELLAITKDSLAWAHLLRIIAQARYIFRSDTTRNINLQNANDRYQYFVKSHPELINKLPQNQIALYLNVNPATLSRLKNSSGNYKK